ncbi:Extra-large guanine nucleotide-binding protein [Arachis hypogaea]|nr:Extra-large guanine nucleotide-binding protein [Arachis hypogaea]
MFSRRNGDKCEMEGIWRKPRADMESVRFSTSNHPDEGTSNSYNDTGGANKVQNAEQDRTELLRKLDELKGQLGKSSEAVSDSKEKVRPDERMIPPDPWFPDGSSRLNRTSRQFFGTDKHVAGPPYFNYCHDPYAYTSGHEMAMPNFHPAMHNLNHIPGYGDPYASQMLRRGPHQFLQQSMHPYFPGRYVDSSTNYEPYTHNAMLHPSSCSCFHCYDNKRRGPVPAHPGPFGNSRFPDTPNDPMLYNHGPHARTAIPPKQLHNRWPSDFNSEMSGFVRSRPRKVMLASGRQHCRPIAGGSPFITCHNCFELLQLPKKVMVMLKGHRQKVRCGACSTDIIFTVINSKLVVSSHPERADDGSNEVVSRRMFHPRGHMNRSGVNFSSDDYSGYEFHSVDREPLSLVAGPSSNSNKSQDMQSFHSSSPSTSEDENSLEMMTAPSDATKAINGPSKGSSSPPAGSPLQEYFDYSNNNYAVNRFGKGNRSSRSEQDKAKVDKVTSRQNSLKEAAVATEMDVHDYSNTAVSLDSRDASREHDHPKSNKGTDSFLANIIKKSFRDFSRSAQTDDRSKINVTVNGHPISDRVIKKAEKLAGPIQPGNYWYDFRAGFWGVMGGPCLGIIPPFIDEFNYPLSDKCSGGNTGVFVNGRELHLKDLDLLAGRGLPTERDRSYIIEISGRVLDEDTGEELESLGKLAPTVEKVKHGFGMKVPRPVA